MKGPVRVGLPKRRSDIGAQQIEKQHARNQKPCTTTQEVTSHEIHEVSNDLRGDDKYSQTPPPGSLLEPTHGCYH